MTVTLPQYATADQVEAALDSLGTDVDVTGGPNGVFRVTFPAPGDQPPIVVSETRALFETDYATPTVNPTVAGTTLQVPRSAHFTPEQFIGYTESIVNGDFVRVVAPFKVGTTGVFHEGAHIVGAIADFNELGADVFKFLDTNANGVYDFANGEVPVDGLIAAKVFNQTAPTNFTPQARYVLATIQTPNGKPIPTTVPFFDFNNQI
jgi:hypothetical protein